MTDKELALFEQENRRAEIAEKAAAEAAEKAERAVLPPVLDGVEMSGNVNTSPAILLEQIRHSISLQHPQVWAQQLKPEVIAIVGSGPSLESTFEELRALVWSGAKLVALNGAYQYCIDRGLKPSAQVLLDARPSGARFVTTVVPDCRYYIASQCHASVWETLQDRANVGIWHAVVREGDSETAVLLDGYYGGQWTEIAGGTTVATRALMLFRTMGWLRFHIFGVDSCFFGDKHHAFAQPENDHDKALRFTIGPSDNPEISREFYCAPWMMQQFVDFLQMIRYNGSGWKLRVHGDGLLAWAINVSAGQFTITEG